MTIKDFTGINKDVRCAVIFLFAAAMAWGQTPSPLLSQRAVLDQYCVTCHNQKLKTAGLMLDKLDLAHVGEHAEAVGKSGAQTARRHDAAAGLPRPNAAAYEALTVALENELDRAAAANPKLARSRRPSRQPDRIRQRDPQPARAGYRSRGVPAGRRFQLRLRQRGQRTEVSPALVEGYVAAATKISRLALGHETAPARKVYHVREDYSQEEHIDGLPFGTRGGMLIHHYFPADGEYVISWDPGAHHGRRFVWRRQRGRTAGSAH